MVRPPCAGSLAASFQSSWPVTLLCAMTWSNVVPGSRGTPTEQVRVCHVPALSLRTICSSPADATPYATSSVCDQLAGLRHLGQPDPAAGGQVVVIGEATGAGRLV